jgi:hypothetical protein
MLKNLLEAGYDMASQCVSTHFGYTSHRVLTGGGAAAEACRITGVIY